MMAYPLALALNAGCQPRNHQRTQRPNVKADAMGQEATCAAICTWKTHRL